MNGAPEVLEELNKNLNGELTAINQYLAHAGLLQNNGYSKLAVKIKGIAKQEREHSEELIERIMFLHGKLTRYAPEQTSEPDSILAMLEADLSLERTAFNDYNEGARVAVVHSDNGSRDLMTHILHEEEEHINFFESQLLQIQQMGLENYLASQI